MADARKATVSSISHFELYQKWLKLKHLDRNSCCNGLVEYVLGKRNACRRETQDKLIKFIKNIEKRWKLCNRDQIKFSSKNKTWLESTIIFLEKGHGVQESEPSKVGRPSKQFEDCGTRAKQRKVLNLVTTTNIDELSFATQVSLRKSGRRDAAKIVQDITKPSSPKRAKKYKRAYKSMESGEQTVVPLTPEEALSLIVNTKSSKTTYLAYRMAAKSSNADIYPSWNKILLAKRACYPDPSSITLKDTEVEIRLQDLLNLTANRICQLQADVLKSFSSNRLILLCKWGLDGSSGQSNYRQLTKANTSDSSVLIISLVPLQLRDIEDETKILWQNPVPSSTRFCRVVKFVFSKETPKLTMEETKKIQKQIADLCDFVFEEKSISFKLILTMVDGKVCHTLTDTKSTQCCYVCQAKPKEMNDLKNIDKKLARTENYNFGLSTLHSWIRFFECCLHVGYRMDIKSWQIRGENKDKMETRKKQIIDGLRKELGILVDQPKPGYGSTNTGNTARIFFRNSKKSAEITGVDEEIIQRFYIILQTISCGYEVDPEKFKIYAMDTAKKFVSLYPWFYMPTSVHKVLIHGAEIINHIILPIGQLGEEAQEAKNKDFKFIREHRSRKDSAEHTNIDLFNYFLLSSDPIISHLSLKDKYNKNKLRLDAEATNLLKSPSLSKNIDSNSSSSDSE